MKKILISAMLAVSSLQANFFIPQEMIDSNLKNYSEEEKVAISKDLRVVRSVCFPDDVQANAKHVYVASAGGPGSRKTTILEKFIDTHSEFSDCVYLDPDPRTLKYMVHTYISRSLSPLVISESASYDEVIKNAYNKWRFGSIYISAVLLEEAFQNRYDVAHGTTLTGEIVPRLLQAVKDGGYEITLLLCSASDDFRVASITRRNQDQRFYQSSPDDAVAKGLLFPQRMQTYFTLADNLYFYWSDSLQTPECLAATFEKGSLTILDQKAWNSISEKYEADRELLKAEGKQLPSWEELLVNLNRR